MAKIAGCLNVSKTPGVTALTWEFPQDVGEIDEEVRKVKVQALEDGTKIIFPFRSECGGRFWLISDADRALTTILLAG